MPISPPLADGIANALGVLEGLGMRTADVRVSPLADFAAAGHAILLTEGFALHHKMLAERPDIYGEALADRMSLGALFTAADVQQAQRRRRQLVAELDGLFETADVLITGMPIAEAPLIDTVGTFASYDKPVFSLPGNLAPMSDRRGSSHRR